MDKSLRQMGLRKADINTFLLRHFLVSIEKSLQYPIRLNLFDNPIILFKKMNLKKKEDCMKKIGVALGGGGARGLCHIRFLEVLDRYHIKPAIISGTSIGSIIGAFWADGMPAKEMNDLLKNLDFKSITRLLDFTIFGFNGLIKGKGVEDFLNKNIAAKSFSDLAIPLKIIATDFWNRRECILDKGDIINAIRASISVPGLFNPVLFEDRILIDGGSTNPLPYDIIFNDCDVVIAIDVTGEKTPTKKRKRPTLFENIINTFQIMESSIVENKMKSCKPHLYIKPALRNIELLDFHKHEEILQSVDEDVEKFEKKINSLLNEKYSFSDWIGHIIGK